MRRFIFAKLLALAALSSAAMFEAASAAPAPLRGAAPLVQHKIYGTVESLRGSTLVIRMRTGRLLTIDGRYAHSSVRLSHHRPVIAYGTIDSRGIMHANAVWRTFPDSAHWPPDH